jgi:hypothetical protein
MIGVVANGVENSLQPSDQRTELEVLAPAIQANRLGGLQRQDQRFWSRRIKQQSHGLHSGPMPCVTDLQQ